MLADEKKRRALYSEQMTQTLEAATALLANENRAQATFIVATRTEYVRPMFSLGWTSFLASFRYWLCELEIFVLRLKKLNSNKPNLMVLLDMYAVSL